MTYRVEYSKQITRWRVLHAEHGVQASFYHEDTARDYAAALELGRRARLGDQVRYPALLVVGLIIGWLLCCCGQASAAQPAEAHRLEWTGLPEGTPVYQGQFVLAFDGGRRVARWVHEYLDADVVGDPSERPGGFVVDPRVPRDIRPSDVDYVLRYFDKGHLAASGNYGDPAAKLATFTYSNCAPQHKDLNRGLWKDLEAQLQAEARGGARLYVDTCAVFLNSGKRVEYVVTGPHHVGVPTHFGKAVLEVDGNWHPLRARAWLFWNRAPRDGETLENLQVSVDELELYSGLDFNSAVNVEVQADLESTNHFLEGRRKR